MVDTTLRLSTGTSSSATTSSSVFVSLPKTRDENTALALKKLAEEINDPNFLRLGINNDEDDKDDGDDDDQLVLSPEPLRSCRPHDWFSATFHGRHDHDRSCTNSSLRHDHHHHHPPVVLNPKPLRCYPVHDHHPTQDHDDDDDWFAAFEATNCVASTSSYVNNNNTTTTTSSSSDDHDRDQTSRDGKRKLIINDQDQNNHAKKKTKRNNNKFEMENNPAAPIPPQLLKRIGLPVFLYRKKLAESDTKKSQNRLFVTESQRLDEFMTEEEREAVYKSKRGVDVIGMDGLGREYDRLRVTWWPSLNMTAVNKQWHEIVVKNEARSGHWVDLWGFRRRDGKLCLLVIFTDLGEDDKKKKKKKKKTDEQDNEKKREMMKSDEASTSKKNVVSGEGRMDDLD